ncbi:DUF4037 domain-containing protein [Haloimpatiens massiliensis]|uniref:DUF4037 domain-containing protein n=1 Tax=Haloimpatiens massiliensis TaxID=1658110 RepID=UPI000C858083|nr:DUF4037 domain-containing protein [Haloimpatiens massiliensis]
MNDIFVCKSQKEFIPGLQLNREFYFEIIKPLIDKEYPNLRYTAALIGHCSDVFGFDDYKSTDHVWGPRLQIFLEEESFNVLKEELDTFFKYNLPFKYKGFPTNYKAVEGWFNNAYMQFKKTYPINHFIEIEKVDAFLNSDIRINQDLKINFDDWLMFPVEHLLELTSGEVFHDGIGYLTKARKVLEFFPDEVLILRIFILWKSINEEQAFIGRCAEKDDRIGESVITNRIINKLMKICFYYEKKYFPYSKWFGTAFKKLEMSKIVSPLIEKVIISTERKERETALNELYTQLIHKHNSLGLTDYVEPKIINYYVRGYMGFDSELILKELSKKINWSKVKDIDLLSKVELFDDSYFGCNYLINKKIVEESIIKNYNNV